MKINKQPSLIKFLTKAATFAALYATLTLVLAPFAFGAVQFRLSEALCVLPFIIPEAIPGLFVGCIISNLFTPNFLILDVVFGSLATLAAAYLTYLCSKIPKGFYLAPLPPVVMNALVIGLVIAYGETGGNQAFLSSFCFNALSIGISEAVVTYVFGLPLLHITKKRFFTKNNKSL